MHQDRSAMRRRRAPLAASVAALSVVTTVVLVAGCGAAQPGARTPDTTPASPRGAAALSPPVLSPPDTTPLADPPAEPASDGTTATISTEKGDIVIELFTRSSPVAARNFISLAEAGFYRDVVFHRLVPGFVIQGGDPTGTGSGGPGYTIEDEPVVGRYGRGVVAMARTPEPDSQGSQFFIVLSDEAEPALEAYRTYAIFGRVTSGMEVVDAIAAMPNSGEATGNQALDPVAITDVVVTHP